MDCGATSVFLCSFMSQVFGSHFPLLINLPCFAFWLYLYIHQGQESFFYFMFIEFSGKTALIHWNCFIKSHWWMLACLLPYIKSCAWKGEMIYVKKCSFIIEEIICKCLFLHWRSLKGSSACYSGPVLCFLWPVQCLSWHSCGHILQEVGKSNGT